MTPVEPSAKLLPDDDLAGREFGGWTVLEDSGERGKPDKERSARGWRGHRLWRCRCACGWEAKLSKDQLKCAARRGAKGCYVCRGMVYRDIANRTFGYWTALRPHDYTAAGFERWWCRCACGMERAVLKSQLLSPSRASKGPQSCGCATRAKWQANREVNRPRRQVAQAWQRMKRYYREGVPMHPPWLASFETFLADVGLAPSYQHGLYRLSRGGGFMPGNVAWMLKYKGYRWARSTRLVTVEGETMPLAALAEQCGIHKEVLAHRLKKVSVEEAIKMPTKPHCGWARKGKSVGERNRQRERAVTLLASGKLSVPKVATKVGISDKTLCVWMKEPAFAASVQQKREAIAHVNANA